jgi:magnesium-transporting ATPase (P-type)
MREVMKIMGLEDWAHQLSWFLTAFITFFWISLSTTILCHASFLPASSPSLLMMYFFTFCMSEVSFAFFISAFFSQAKLAAIIGPVALFCTLLPRFIFFGTNRYEAPTAKYFASLLSPTAFSFGADIIADYEYAGIGVQRDNMFEGEYNFGGCIQMMLFDFFLYAALAWYLDQVSIFYTLLDLKLIRYLCIGHSTSSWYCEKSIVSLSEKLLVR